MQCRKKNVLSEWLFRHKFNTNFNLSFHKLKVDTCRKCDKIAAKIKSVDTPNASETLLNERSEHLKIVDKTRKDFDECIERARFPKEKTEVLTFDLQRALETPRISTSEAFYKRQLWVYNLCVFDEVRKTGYMYVWNESIASRGSQEIGFCIYRHIAENVSKDTRKIILYSDSCSGQNRNIKIALMFKWILDGRFLSKLQRIEQRFFVSGHSYNSCDRCFGTIEKENRRTEHLLIPEHWYGIMKEAKKTLPKFRVIEMEKTNFFSTAELENLIINRKKTIDGKRINWFDIQNIIYKQQNPLTLLVRVYSSIVAPILSISIAKKKNTTPFREIVKLNLLFTDGRAISKQKYDDLQSLLQYIPNEFHDFYTSLRYTNENDKDFALASRQSSDEEECEEE